MREKCLKNASQREKRNSLKPATSAAALDPSRRLLLMPIKKVKGRKRRK
jgi:hypothetical protein